MRVEELSTAYLVCAAPVFGPSHSASQPLTVLAAWAGCVLGTEVFPVSASAVDACLEGIYSRLDRETGAVVVVHLGVNAKSTGAILLECQAVNEASFRVPDTTGWQPVACCIDGSCSLDATLRCDLPLQALAGALRPAAFREDSQPGSEPQAAPLVPPSLQIGCRTIR